MRTTILLAMLFFTFATNAQAEESIETRLDRLDSQIKESATRICPKAKDSETCRSDFRTLEGKLLLPVAIMMHAEGIFPQPPSQEEVQNDLREAERLVSEYEDEYSTLLKKLA